MAHSVALLTIGSEILDGRVQDTNSHYLISELTAAGIAVDHVLSCTDSMNAIKRSLDFLVPQCRVLIVTGGLGPTSDDITREAIAEFADLKLVLHGDVLGRLEAYFRARKRPFDPSNCKQALFPDGSVTIENPVGSALGFLMRAELAGEQKLLFSLPGVPIELHAMFKESVLPAIRRELGVTTPLERRGFRIFGLGESVIGSLIQQSEPHRQVSISYRAHFPQVEVLFKGSTKSAVDGTVKRARHAIGEEYIYTENTSESMETVLHTILSRRKLTLAVAESCTGGLIGELLTNTPGSSQYFLGGAVTYHNQLKVDLLGVSRKLIRNHGAVSDAVAQAMAEGIRKATGAGIAISVTGLAGPSGGNAAKPVGTFYVGLSHGRTVNSYKFFLHSSRKAIRTYAAWMALDVLRRHLLKLPIHPHRDPHQAKPRA